VPTARSKAQEVLREQLAIFGAPFFRQASAYQQFSERLWDLLRLSLSSESGISLV
jgi:hypothetical protein